MDAGRRHDIPGSETENFITQSKASSKSIMLASVPLAPTPKSHRGSVKEPCGCSAYKWVCVASEQQENGGPTSFIEGNKQALCPGERNYFIP